MSEKLLLCIILTGVTLTLLHNGKTENISIDGNRNVSVIKIGNDGDGNGILCKYSSSSTGTMALRWYLNGSVIPRRIGRGWSSHLGWTSLPRIGRNKLQEILKREANEAASEGVFSCRYNDGTNNPPSASVGLYYPGEHD